MADPKSFSFSDNDLPNPKVKWWVDSPRIRFKGFWFKPEYVKAAMAIENHFKPLPSDILLASFPKTGTTWLKALTFPYLHTTNRNRLFCYQTRIPMSYSLSLKLKHLVKNNLPIQTSFHFLILQEFSTLISLIQSCPIISRSQAAIVLFTLHAIRQTRLCLFGMSIQAVWHVHNLPGRSL